MAINTEYENVRDDLRRGGAPLSEIVLPVFFREEAKPLYACHHLPSERSPSKAILICNSVAHESERCHRSLRQLAMQLARAGQHVTRFDYFGTGDSAGEFTEGSFDQWRKDVADAIDECKHQSKCNTVFIVGVRVGATLAVQVAVQRDDVESLVLYAPVVDGPSLLSEWRGEQEKFFCKHSHKVSELASDELLGFPLTEALQSELRQKFVVNPPGAALRHVLIAAEDALDEDVTELSKLLASGGANVDIQSFDDVAIWRREPSEAVVPFKLLRRVTKWIKGVSGE